MREAKRRAELASAQTRAAIGALDTAVLLYDENERLVAWNPSFERMFPLVVPSLAVGASAEAIRREEREAERRAGLVAADADDEAWVAASLRSFREGRHEELRERDGGCDLVSHLRTDAGGSVSLYQDVTELVESQRTARQLSDAIDAFSDSVILYDANERVTFTNRRYHEIYPTSPSKEDIVGQTQEALLRRVVERGHIDLPLAARDPETWIATRMEERRRGDGIARETAHANGRHFLYRNVRSSSGGSMVVQTEITELKRAQAQLERARDDAEAGARAKAAFLASMSHEIRTPMNGVVGMVDLLRETRLDAEQADMVDTVRESAMSLLTVINDILDFSKIDAGHMALERVPTSLAELVGGVVRTMRPVAQGKNITIAANIDPALPGWVLTDPVRLRQVLFNLAGNAVKFTQQGTVTLTASRLEGSQAGGAHVRIAVADTGIGIADDARASLFDAFTQAESSTTRRFGGTGLGLAISQRIAMLLGSSIAVESEVGFGSTFSFDLTFELAAAPVADDQAVASAASVTDPGAVSILVAEDNPINRKVLGRQLAQLGYTFEMAEDGVEALAALEGGHFGLLLTDWHMPNMDGRELVERVRAVEPDAGWRLPIIAVTASVTEEEQSACIDAGVDAVVAKPVELRRLQEALGQCLSGLTV